MCQSNVKRQHNDYMCGWATASQMSSGYAIIVCVAMHTHAHERARQLHGSLQGSFASFTPLRITSMNAQEGAIDMYN